MSEMKTNSLPPEALPPRDSINLPPQKHWFYKCLLVFFGLLIGLACVELYLRMYPTEEKTKAYGLSFYTHDGQRISTLNGPLHLALNPFTLYKNIPNQKTETFTINSHGFRGPEFSAKKDSRTRIMLVGGSAAFGLGAQNDAETFLAQLQQRHSQYEWINAGVCGFLSGQELAYIVTELVDYDPNIIIAYDGWNDFFGAWFHANCLRAPKRKGELGSNLFVLTQLETQLIENYNTQVHLCDSAGRFLNSALDKSVIVSRVRKHFQNSEGGLSVPKVVNMQERSEQEKSDYFESIVRSYTGNIQKMRDFCQSRGIKLLVVLQPDLGLKETPTLNEKQLLFNMKSFLGHYVENYDDEFPKRYKQFIKSVETLLKLDGIEAVDISEDPQFQSSDRTTFGDTVHTNRSGNEIIAAILYERLRDRGWVE